MAQCEYITSTGQCPHEAISPGRFCQAHSATSAKTMMNQYRIACSQLGDSPERHAKADQLKSISGEIVIMRSLLESRLNMIENPAEMVAAMPMLKEYALAVEKLATSCHTMDVKIGNLLDKQALMNLAREIIAIIETNIRPLADTTPTGLEIDELVEAIGQDLITAIAAQENQNA
jgi:hypothetical protein